MYYTGIGAYNVRSGDLLTAIAVASMLAKKGYTLRSGHSQGVDRAFELGAGGKANIYLPWRSFGTKAHKKDSGSPVNGTWLSGTLGRKSSRYRAMLDVCKFLKVDLEKLGNGVQLLLERYVACLLGRDNNEEKSRFLVIADYGRKGSLIPIIVEVAKIHCIPVANITQLGKNKAVKVVKECMDCS